MGAKTGIEWTDSTWNPVTGCTKVSAGCKNCYAETVAERFRGHAAFPNGFDLTLRPERLYDPLRWQRPRRIFVCSMSDLFHERIEASWIGRVFDVMEQAAERGHTFQVLTKRSIRMAIYLRARYGEAGVPAHIWCGVSVEHAERDVLERIEDLRMTPAKVRFLSCEPLLGSLYAGIAETSIIDGIDWVIVGGESGRRARPMEATWAREIRDLCREQGTAFFMKQMANREPIPEDLMVREYPDGRS